MRDPNTYEEFAFEKSDPPWDVRRLQSHLSRWVAAGLAQLLHVGRFADKWVVHLQMRCERPGIIHRRAKVSHTVEGCRPLVVTSLVRCRKCTECERSNSMRWAARAVTEFTRSERTWFGTLTLRPDEHSLVDAWAASEGLWPDKARLSEERFNRALFQARCKIIGDQVSTWLDVIRDVAYLRTHKRELVRYLLVAERHDSAKTGDFMRGRPHFHLVLHEVEAGAAVVGDVQATFLGQNNGDLRCVRINDDGILKTKVFVDDNAVMRKAWVLGHSKFEYCVDERAAFYVCKYMYQSDMARVRASKWYGRIERTESVGDQKENYGSFSSSKIDPPNGLSDFPLPSGEGLGEGEL